MLEELQNQNKQHTNFFIENISGRDESNQRPPTCCSLHCLHTNYAMSFGSMTMEMLLVL